MGEEIVLAGSEMLKNREKQLVEFIKLVFDDEDAPYFISDDASFFDIYADDPEFAIDKCIQYYQVKVDVDMLKLPLWQLLDILNSEPE